MKRPGDIGSLEGVAEKDRKMIRDAEAVLGPEPDQMGFVKNLFWGRVHEDSIFPYPELSEIEKLKSKVLLETLDRYLENEHPSIQIDQEQEIPEWVIKRLFEIGVMGMTIGEEYGGLDLGITSYNQVLQRIGAKCASTSVVVSAHQSIGCKALMLYGTPEQKRKFLPDLAKKSLSAFCLSEPNVGCDAGGQETYYEISDDGNYYILNGEKKWATSAAWSDMFTVIAKEKGKENISAFICTPAMKGIDIFENNRSKCGIRGTWQARIRFTNVWVPKENLLHTEGKGLQVALTCLNYGRCTLSAGILGSAIKCRDQATKWSQTRYQFNRPLSDFQLMREKVARMSALTYAMDAMLYMTTGMLDRDDQDIMVETAVCKVFCSEMGWRIINDSMQIMGGEGYMTENEVERALRDSRIYLIVEGANEVMQAFIFAYGGKQLAEHLLTLEAAVEWKPERSMGGYFLDLVSLIKDWDVLKNGVPLVLDMFFGIKALPSRLKQIHPELTERGKQFSSLVRDLSHHYKLMSLKHREALVINQVVQARLADCAIWLHAMACTLSKLDSQLRQEEYGIDFARDKSAGLYFLQFAELEIKQRFQSLYVNADETLEAAAQTAFAYSDTLANSDFIVPEKSPNAAGSGREPDTEYIKQFPPEENWIHKMATWLQKPITKTKGG